MVGQVITVQPDGTMSGLQVKAGKGLDLRQFGKAAIVRASEIAWDEEDQAWAVEIQDAPGLEAMKGLRVTPLMAHDAGVRDTLLSMVYSETANMAAPTDAVTFPDYDDAVKFEIAFLNAHRLKGRF